MLSKDTQTNAVATTFKTRSKDNFASDQGLDLHCHQKTLLESSFGH